MSTNAQILANRRNALKSTGPRTPQGKAAVSQNAVRHGLTAASDVISSESQAEFRLYRDQLFAELAPASPLESILAERVVTLSWRLKRVFRIQNQTIDALSAPKPPGPLAKLTKSFAFKTPFQPPQPDLSEFADRHPQGNASAASPSRISRMQGSSTAS